MHLNLPFADAGEFTRLHAAVRLVVPILPALAASSPILGGVPVPWLDARMREVRTLQARVPATMGRIVPDTATGPSAYRDEVLAAMYRDIAPFDPKGMLRHEWLNARGAVPRFERSAIEIRVADVQECPLADSAVAAAAGAVVRALYEERWSDLADQQVIDTDALVAILDDCIRKGDRAEIRDGRYLRLLGCAPGEACRADALWRHLVETFAPDARLQRPLQLLLDQGPLARRILKAVGPEAERCQLADVYPRLSVSLPQAAVFDP